MPGVEGRIDHLSVDLKGQRLFVAALENNTIEVLDLAQGKRIRSIGGLKEPQGIFFVPEFNQVFVASGGDGTLKAFDAMTYSPVYSVDAGGDADNIRYDPATKTIVVGYGNGAIGTVNTGSRKLVSSTKLSGHPESFQLEKSRPRIYVNVPTANQIAVVDRIKQTVTTTWPLGEFRSNFPMALDEANHRLFIGTRQPARLVIFDTESGKQIAALNCSGDTDDIFYDAAGKRVYLSAGEGFIDVFRQQDPDHYQQIGKIPTAPGARTSLFVPELHRIFVAVPHRGNQASAIRAYEAAGP
jgi:DNA-binding beta-propeller fold protein YncE